MKGSIELVFKEDGWLGLFSLMEAELSHEQINRFIYDRLPIHVDDLHKSMPPYITITEQQIVVTFDTFWNRYKLKRNKVDAEALWNKLNESEKLVAVQRIKVYDKYCEARKGWYNKMFPDTWLRKKHFNDEWETM